MARTRTHAFFVMVVSGQSDRAVEVASFVFIQYNIYLRE